MKTQEVKLEDSSSLNIGNENITSNTFTATSDVNTSLTTKLVTILSLPFDILCMIFTFISLKNIKYLIFVCKTFKKVIDSNIFIRKRLHRWFVGKKLLFVENLNLIELALADLNCSLSWILKCLLNQ